MKSNVPFLLAILVTVTVRYALGQRKSDAQLMQEFNTRLEQARQATNLNGNVRDLIQRIKAKQSANRKVSSLVCYGIGAFFPGQWLGINPAERQDPTQLGAQFERLPFHYRQLALCEKLRTSFSLGKQASFYADPILEPIEHHLMQTLYFTPDNHSDCGFPVASTGLTIVFAPSLPCGLNENILAANWSPAKLQRLIFVGSDMSTFLGLQMRLVCWDYVIRQQVAQIWSPPGSSNALFQWLVTFQAGAVQSFPTQHMLADEFERRLLAVKVAGRGGDAALVNRMNTGGRVGHLAIYGIGPFMEVDAAFPTQEGLQNKEDMSQVLSIRNSLNATGTFYMQPPLPEAEQRYLRSRGFVPEDYNLLEHHVYDGNTKTLVAVFADYSRHLDNVLAVNWSPANLNKLVIMWPGPLQFDYFILWQTLQSRNAIRSVKVDQFWYLYFFQVTTALPSVPAVASRLIVTITGPQAQQGGLLMAGLTQLSGRVGHIAVYGIGAFLEPTQNSARTKEVATTVMALRDALNATATFYMRIRYSYMQQAFLHDKGVRVELDDQLGHRIEDTSCRTLVAVYGQYSDHLDNILAANWSPEQLNQLVVMEADIEFGQYLLWNYLHSMNAIRVNDIGAGGMQVYSFYVTALPSVERLFAERVCQSGPHRKPGTASYPSSPGHGVRRAGYLSQ